MPKISVVIDPLPLETKRELATIFTDELNRVTGIPKPDITVFFEELPRENIFSGGVMLRDKLAARESKGK